MESVRVSIAVSPIGGMLIAAILAATVACSSGKLTKVEAERAIRQHKSLPQDVAIEVEGIAQGEGAAEAIVRARILDSAVNLKLRRFDTGWMWVAVETQTGTWIDASTAVGQLIEQQRRKRTIEWAKQHLDEYERTAYAMKWYFDSVPGGTAISMREGWLLMREVGIKGARSPFWSNAERDERIKRYSEPAVDAWGTEVRRAFDEGRRTATFISLGPDTTVGTLDDLVVTCVGHKEWSDADGRLIWNYTRTFQLPLGLEVTVAKYREDRDTVKTTLLN